MKIFVDTSVWINYFSGRNTDKTKQLSEVIESGQSIYSLAVIIQEVLQGFKHDKDISAHVDKLEALSFLPFEFQDAVEAAKLYRSLRKQGITCSTIDLQIAAICIRHEFQLLTEDGDFSAIAQKFNFALA